MPWVSREKENNHYASQISKYTSKQPLLPNPLMKDFHVPGTDLPTLRPLIRLSIIAYPVSSISQSRIL